MKNAIAHLLKNEDKFQKIVTLYGEPTFVQRPPGFETLCLLILEQQVSIDSAKATFNKIKKTLPDFL
ncbi:MAG TPA: hypothetical protein VLB74_00340, partial [Flavobacterium sp.]|nr:hypothetical protein [Flavobacterium sp.]